jgi:hypothetical protein
VLVKEEAEPAGGTRSAARKFDELVRGRQQLGRLRPNDQAPEEGARAGTGERGRRGRRQKRESREERMRLFGSSYFSRAGNFSILRYIFFREAISLSTFSTKYQ